MRTRIVALVGVWLLLWASKAQPQAVYTPPVTSSGAASQQNNLQILLDRMKGANNATKALYQFSATGQTGITIPTPGNAFTITHRGQGTPFPSGTGNTTINQPGYLRLLQFTFGAGLSNTSWAQNGQIRLYFDGAVNPQAVFPFSELGCFADAFTTANGQYFSTPNMGVSMFGTTTTQFSTSSTVPPGTESIFIRYPMPFNTLRVELYNPTGNGTPSSGAYCRIEYQPLASGETLSPLRFMTFQSPYINAPTYTPTQQIPMMNAANLAGWLVGYGFTARGSDYSYADREFSFGVDGDTLTTTPGGVQVYSNKVITGTEEWLAGYYFEGLKSINAPPHGYVTTSNNSNSTMAFFWDILADGGGLRFTTQIAGQRTGKEGFVVGSSEQSGWLTCLYYDTSVPFAPTAPQSATSTPAAASGMVSWVPPASPGTGASGITGYTVTLSPGGATTTVAGNVTSATLMGLTNGTAYTASVVATNANGNSAAATTTFTPNNQAGLPVIVSAQANATQSVAVTWTNPAVVSSVGSYVIKAYSASGVYQSISQTVAGSGTAGANQTASITGLTNDTPYKFTVYAVGTGGASNSAETGFSDICSTASSSIFDDFALKSGPLHNAVTEIGSKTWSGSHYTSVGGFLDNSYPTIASSLASSAVTSTGDQVFATVDTGANTMDVSMKIGTIGSVAGFTTLAWCLSDNSHYGILQLGSGGASPTYYWLGYRDGGGTYTQIGATIATAPAAGDVLRVVKNGTTVTCYLNGTQVYTGTVASPPSWMGTATRAGFIFNAQGSAVTTTIDWFKAN